MSMLINFGMTQQAFLDEVFERKPALLRRAVACQSYTWDTFSQEFFSIHPAAGGIRILFRELEQASCLGPSQKTHWSWAQ